MATVIRQSTQITGLMGPFLDKTDGVTEETGLAGNGTEISKNGGAYAAGPTLGTHDAEGYYPVTLTTSHTDTVGRLRIKSHDSATHLPVWHEYQVVEEAVYDALYASGALGPILLGANSSAVSFTGGMTISNSGGNALTLSSSGGNGAGLSAAGNGSGPGIRGTGGATGQGILGVGGSTSGAGIRGTGTAGNAQGIYGVGQGSAAGVQGTGGATGNGILGTGGATSGAGIRGTGTAGNSQGIYGVGQGSASGIAGLGGATGHGILGSGGTNGDGIRGTLGGTGVDIRGNITGNVTGNLSGSAGSVTGNVGGNVVGSVASVTGAVGSVTGNVGGNVVGSVASVTGAVGSVTGNVGGIAGTITTLDALDTAQDSQHATTQGKVDVAQAYLDLLTGTDGATLATSQPNYAPATAAALATAQTDLDTITGSDGVTLATAQGLYAPSKAGDAMALTSGERTTLTAAIWAALTSGLTTAGSIGKKLADWTIHSAADVWSVATRVLTANTNLNDPTAAAIADAVWDEATSGHAVSGSTGEALTNATAPTAAAVADAVWDEAISGHAVSGSTGEALANASAPTAAAVADAVWDEALSGHATSGSAGEAMSAAGGAADPLLNAVPGSYGSGTAGEALGSITGIKAKTDLITTGTSVTLTSPVADDSDVTIEQGDDYASADGRSLDWSSTGYPDLTGATVVMRVEGITGTYTASVLTAGGATQTVRVELTDVQTAAIPVSRRGYEIQATLASGNVVSLVRGTLTCRVSY